MAKYHAEGKYMDYTPVADVAAGQAVKIGSWVGIADNPIPANTKGALRFRGIYRFVTIILSGTINVGTEMDVEFTNGTAVANGSGDTAVKIFAAETKSAIAGGAAQEMAFYINNFGL